MKKVLLALFLFVFIFPVSVSAEQVASVELNQVVPPTYFYARTDENLVLDFTINLAETDTLETIFINNQGSAQSNKEITSVNLWKDEGNGQFDGFGVDTDLGEATFYSLNSWYYNELNEALKIGDNRFFVTIELKANGTFNKSFQFALPSVVDSGELGVFELGDRGIFLGSGETIPSEQLTNEGIGKYKSVLADIFAPKAYMENLNGNMVLTTESYTITGQAKDSGGGSVDFVNVCIDEVCTKTEKDELGYLTWHYDWTGIEEGTYEIYLTAQDLSNNKFQSESFSLLVDYLTDKPPIEDDDPDPAPPVIDYTDGEWVTIDGNSAVYFIDKDSKRHAYPTLGVWQSYFADDFSFVQTITLADLQQYDLSVNVPFKAGSLMKMPSVAKVYYVTADRQIRWLPNETVAKSAAGADWNKNIYEMPESFFPDYTVGADWE